MVLVRAAMLASARAASMTRCEWSSGALSVSWASEEASDYYEVQVAREERGEIFAVFSTAETDASLDFLVEERSYWLKVRSHREGSPSLGPGTWRDVGVEVECKTGTSALPRPAVQETAGTMVLEVLRQSEFSYDVDYLMNHNSGDLGGDTSFVVSVAADPDQPGFLNTTFRRSVFTLYCLEVLKTSVPDTVTTDADDRFADYLSCNDNGNATDPQCECDNWIDRFVSKGEEQTKYCHQSDGSECSERDFGRDCQCECTEDSLAYSAQFVGMMPVYQGQSELLGHWYSTPKQAECGEREVVGQRRADGTLCTWKRGREARVVRGGDALVQGWNTSAGVPGQVDPVLVRQNVGILRDLFDSQPFQRWSCESSGSAITV